LHGVVVWRERGRERARHGKKIGCGPWQDQDPGEVFSQAAVRRIPSAVVTVG
jgi:hypothetical protein